MKEEPKPDPQFIAQQLRKPSGEFAKEVAANMDKFNAPLVDLTLDSMQLKDDESVLEIGFGGGKSFNKLFQKASRLRLSGIDYSPEMVSEARNYNQSSIDSNRLNLKQGNSNNIPFPDAAFDKVFCNNVVYFWDQPGEHLKEIHRILKPKGRFYTGIRTKSSMQGLPFTQYNFTLFDEDQWSSVLEGNGFKTISANKKMDPGEEIDGQEIQMESVCIVGQKI